MSSFILCHERKANKPFYLEDINLNIYTIEELCFYLCNNLYLLNHRILNKELCSWIDEELGMSHLAGLLIQTLPSQSLVRFVVTILSHVGFCEEGELEDIQHTLLSLKDQSEEEQRKRKADNLLNNGKYESALIEYERILRKKTSDRLGREFYGKVHHNKGVAFAKQFMYQEAAQEFGRAYELSGKKESLQELLLAEYIALSDEEFKEFLSQNEKFRSAAEQMQNEYSEQERQYRFIMGQKQHSYQNLDSRIEEIKEEYRKTLL